MRGKMLPDLKDELIGLQKEQFNLRIQVTSGQSTNTARMRTVRRDIARIKTLIKEHQDQALGKDSGHALEEEA